MRTTTPSLEDQIRSLHFKYEIPTDTLQKLLAAGTRFLDLDKAALLSCLSDTPIETILSLRKEDPWGRIEKKLGLTPTRYHARYIAHRAHRLHRFYSVEEERATALLEEGYPNHWIRLAYLLEQHTGTPMETIIHERKKSEKWKPWAEARLHVSPDDFTRWIADTRNPSLPPKK